jgi:hypothetical protein
MPLCPVTQAFLSVLPGMAQWPPLIQGFKQIAEKSFAGEVAEIWNDDILVVGQWVAKGEALAALPFFVSWTGGQECPPSSGRQAGMLVSLTAWNSGHSAVAWRRDDALLLFTGSGT